jgi:UDP-galactopyranose mutase
VKSLVRGQLFPFPINLTTLETFFNRSLDASAAEQLLARLRQPIKTPGNSEEYVLSRVGSELYEAFYRNYTLKQWGIPASELSPEVCGRIPVRFDRDERYVDHRFQVMPHKGFTALFTRMLRHARIRVLLECDFEEVRNLVRPRHATVYTGAVDEYFRHRLGKLPYRSLRFDFVPYAKEYVQPCVQINYPNDFPYTRSVEIKHVTGQKHPETVISYETPSGQGEPYYPIPAPANAALYHCYKELADAETRNNRVYFCGRLAQYRYFNTDEVIQEALRCFQAMVQRCAPERGRSALSPATAAA